jgi:uncharacterized protein (DUF488 family)
MKVYTLGTNRRSEEDFIEILHYYSIMALVDVRRFPASRFPLYQREHLEMLLKDNRIEYHFLGSELGGLRKGGYSEYVQTEEFRNGMKSVEKVAINKPSVIVCAEKLPWKCHRRWIARELKNSGWQVVHIIDKGKVWEPK